MKSEDQLLTLCQNIRYLRKINGLSKTKMARILGISVRTLTKLEQGIFPPQLGCEVLWRTGSHFRVPLHKLFDTVLQ